MQSSVSNRSKFHPIQFLGSMNLAISLLVIIAIASIIGTILKQNQPYTDYQIKFGSFWFEIFRSLGLYDVYSAIWFLLILAFLVLSTATCVGRNTPGILRELRHFRESIQAKSLLAMKHKADLTTDLPPDQAEILAQQILKNQGFKYRSKTDAEHRVVAGMKGSANHLGYWFTHIGLIVILLGAGILDNGRLGIMIGEWLGKLKPETRNVPADQVPPISQLPVSNRAYRGSVDIPEGSQANIIFIPVRDGYLVQNLPFSVEVKDFRVEHYSTGMPKSFESDIVLYDKNLKEPLKTTISVNHPLVYKDIAIYQANFGDGGSQVNLQLLPFNPHDKLQALTGNVFRDYKVASNDKKYTLELTDFRLFNINDMEDANGKPIKRNVGPSVNFKLRDATGQAIEYQNYFNPIPIKNHTYFISGMRSSPGEPFRYLHIPADAKGTPNRFIAFLTMLQDTELLRRLAQETTHATLPSNAERAQDLEGQMVNAMVQLTQTFVKKGADGIAEEINQRFATDKQAEASKAYMTILHTSLRTVYQEMLRQEGHTDTITDADWDFLDDSIMAIDKISAYGSPWFIQPASFKQIEASGLQITRSPGQSVVYFGSAMLVLGVFLLFYVAHRRVWVWLKPTENNQTEIVVAGTSNRNLPEFEHYFEHLQGLFRKAMNSKQEVQHVDAAGNH
jgi:cytochrome c biogenesis protein